MEIVCLMSGLVIAAAVAVWAVPLADYPTDSTPSVSPPTTAAIARTTDLSSSGQLRLTWSGARGIKLLGASGGVVTALHVRAGRSVGCGELILEINGQSLVTLCGTRPLWRPVSGRVAGPDREEIVQLLRRKGFIGDQVTATSLDHAIRNWQKAIGHQVTGTVLPSDVVWIGSPVVPSTVNAAVGDTASNGLQVLSVRERLTRASLASGLGSDTQPGSRVVSLVGQSESVPLDARGRVGRLSLLEQRIRATAKAGDSPPATLDVVVRLARAIPVVVVPAGSVISGAKGTCVLAATAAGYQPMVVTVVASEIGDVLLAGGPQAGQQVVTSPPPTTTC